MDLENTGNKPVDNSVAEIDNELATQSELREPFDHNLIAQLEGKMPVVTSKVKLFQNSFWNETCFETDTLIRKNRYFSDSNIDVDSFQASLCSNQDANLDSANPMACKQMMQELKVPYDMHRTHKKLAKQSSPFMDYIKTKSGRKIKGSGEKPGIFPSRFEIDHTSPVKDKQHAARMVEETAGNEDHDPPALDSLQSKSLVIEGSNSEVNLYYVSNVANQNNLENPDIGYNKFLKSSMTKQQLRKSSMDEETREKIHHSEIMRLLNAVENVNHESNLPAQRHKINSFNMILMEVGEKHEDRKHSTRYQSLAEKSHYWKPRILSSEIKSPGLPHFEIPKLNRGSGSFVGMPWFYPDIDLPQCELNRSPSSRPRTFTLKDFDPNNSFNASRNYSVKDQLSRFDDDYQVVETIGSSTLAGVFKCRNRLDGLNYAIKIYSHPVTSTRL